MNLQDGVNLSEVLIITLFSMGIVFLTLIVISFILGAFQLIFYKDSSQQSSVKTENQTIREDTARVNTTNKTDADEEVVAVIAAAISIHTESLVAVIAGAIANYDNSSLEDFNIKNIKKIR